MWSDSPLRERVASQKTSGGLIPAGAPGIRNYFSIHWKGELPLLISVWVNGVLLGLALTVLLVALPWSEFTSRTPKTTALIALLLLPLGCAVAIWQFTGNGYAAS